MLKNLKNLKPKVLFNASVVLAGLYSPNGGSAKVLSYVKNKKVEGYITEIIFDEIIRHSHKLGMTKDQVVKKTLEIFGEVFRSPNKQNVLKYLKVVIDEGDCHVLASAEELNVNYLVSLDKKHILSLKNEFKKLRILSPGELILLINEL